MQQLCTYLIFMTFYIGGLLLKLVKRIQVWLKWTNLSGTLLEDLSIFVIISCGILDKWRKVSDTIFREKENTFHVNYIFSEILTR
jgi:hypothetical protein